MSGKTLKSLSFLLVLAMTVGLAGNAAAEPIFSEQQTDRICQTTGIAFFGWLCTGELDSEIEATQPSEVQFEIYSDFSVQQDTREQHLTEKRSFLNQGIGLIQARAKLDIIEARNNGSTQQEAKDKAFKSVNEFYSKLQISTLAQQERDVIFLNSSVQKINETDDLELSDVFESENEDIGDYPESFNFSKVNVTLYNGSVRDYTQVKVDIQNDAIQPVSDPKRTLEDDADSLEIILVQSGTGLETTAMNGTAYYSMLDRIESDRNLVRNNVINMTDFYYNTYAEGEISVSDELGPLETAITAGTNYASTGGYQYLALSAAQSGYAYNDSYAFQVQWNNTGEDAKVAWGQLFAATGAYNDTLQVNKTYDASGETVIFVHNTEDGKAKETDLDGTFKILKMRDTASGDSVNSTTLQVTEFYTDGVQDLQKQLDEFRDSQDKYIKCTNCGGGIIGPTGGFLADLFNDIFPDLPKISGDVAGTLALGGALGLIFLAAILG